MKSVFLLLPFLLCAVQFCKGQQIDAEHQKKAEKIIQRLSSNKPVPNRLIKEDDVDMESPSKHDYSFFYHTKRTVNGKQVDSVLMGVELNDTVNMLFFTEGYLPWRDNLPMYNYRCKNGMLVLAFIAFPITNKRQDHGESDSTLFLDIEGTSKIKDPVERQRRDKRDNNAVTFYLPKLLYSIDELYDLLFK